MKKNLYFLIFLFVFSYFHSCYSQVNLCIKVKGVENCIISLLPTKSGRIEKSIFTSTLLKAGDLTLITIPKNELPGEFIVRYDYRSKLSDEPYPSEQKLILNRENVSLEVNPPYCNNKDSIVFINIEDENYIYHAFYQDIQTKKMNLNILREVLFRYGNKKSLVYLFSKLEYGKQRRKINKWISKQSTIYSNYFAKSYFNFEIIPKTNFSTCEKNIKKSYLSHYFDNIDFNDSNLYRTSKLYDFLDNYVNLSATQFKNQREVDSFYTFISENVINIAKSGNKNNYGAIVDYFYLGFEKNNLSNPLISLTKFINDPNCLTNNRKEVLSRMQTLRELTIGKLAPNFSLTDSLTLFSYQNKKTKIVMFWSADCSHCRDELKLLYPYYLQNKEKFDIIAVSIDETEAELDQYIMEKVKYPEFIHLCCKNGIDDEIAKKYAILSTPSYFIINGISNNIVSLPLTVENIINYFNNLHE